MAVTLLPIPTVPASPVPNQNSARTAFCDNYARLGTGVMSVRERKALSVLGLLHELKSARSIDYTSKHNQLIQDASVMTRGIPILDLDTAFAVIDWSNGTVDAALSTDLATLMSEARDLVQLPEDTLNRIMVLLEMQLAE